MPNINNYYQVAENASAAGDENAQLVEVEAPLIDFATGLPLIEAGSQEELFGATEEIIVLSRDNTLTPITITNTIQSPAGVNVTNRQQSEIDVSMLGIPRAEVALSLFENVNTYGVNTKEWTNDPGGGFRYTYYQDPTAWTYRDNYGAYTRHIAAESAIQAYCFPPPISFTFSSDDNSGRFPGGYTNGIMTTYWESKRTFRYQPGRVTGFTMGVRMSTGSNYEGEIIQWGCRNDYGDGYYFQLEKGTNLYIIRNSPDLGTLKVPREEWTGNQLNGGDGGWVLDVSKVTMFKIEFSWYGAVGAKFLAYVPIDHGDARWVTLHYILAENQFIFPSLRSPYLKKFTQVRTTAGTQSAAFLNLYGSSVYIDGGDKGTVSVGTASLEDTKIIDGTSRSILGLQVKGEINNIDNQKAIYPTNLAVYASTDARFDLVLQGNGTGAGESYYYGNGTILSRGNSSTIAVTRLSDNVLGGTFPDITAEISGNTNYLSGQRVKVEGTNIYNTHVIGINPALTEITVDRELPSSVSSIRLSRFNAWAASPSIITSGLTDVEGAIFFNTGEGSWRLGMEIQASGSYAGSNNVLWFASKYTGLNYNVAGQAIGEIDLPFEPYRQASFSIVFPSGVSNTIITIAGQSTTLTGVTSPWPIRLIAQLQDGAILNDVVVGIGATEERITPGSGLTLAISGWTVSGLSQSTAVAGGQYMANKFETSPHDPLTAVLVDKQGYRTLRSVERIASYFVGSGETKQFDLSPLFGPDRMFITGRPGTVFNSGALFVMAIARTASGDASATLNWEEQ